jgi:hypothetical protein
MAATTAEMQYSDFQPKNINHEEDTADTLDADKLQQDWQTTENKLNKAVDQMQLLGDRIQQLQIRYQRATRDGKAAFSQSLKLQLMPLQNMYNAYYEYCNYHASKILHIEQQLAALDKLDWS